MFRLAWTPNNYLECGHTVIPSFVSPSYVQERLDQHFSTSRIGCLYVCGRETCSLLHLTRCGWTWQRQKDFAKICSDITITMKLLRSTVTL